MFQERKNRMIINLGIRRAIRADAQPVNIKDNNSNG
jgi:hypothetical protein